MRRGLLHLVVACCVACFAAVTQAAAPTPVEISHAAGQVPVWQALRIVAPADRHLEPAQAAELAAGPEAVSVDNPDRVLGRGTSPYWALFSLYNLATSEQERLLSLETTTQFDVRLFMRQDTGAWRQVDSLADVAAGRIGGGTAYPAWEIHLPPRQSTELLLRVEGPAVIRFPVFVYNQAHFAERERKLHIAFGIALGSCFFIVVAIGSLRRHLDDTLAPLFICMVIADLLGALWLSGFLEEMFPAVSASTLSQIGFAGFAGLYGCGSLHARAYLNTAAWAPRTDKLLLVLGGFWLVMAPWFSLAFPFAARTLLVFGGTGLALILVFVSAWAARRRVPFSGYVGAAWLSYLGFGTALVIARHFDNPVLWSSSAISLLQATVIALLFGLAMSQRMMQQRDLLVAARQDALMQQEKVAALMRERSLLFAATNHDLRQPLLGVGLFADLLRSARTPEDREAHSRKLGMALKEVDELLVGIQQLAAVHDASHRPALQTVKLDDLLAPVIEEYRGRSDYKRLSIRYVPSRLSITTHVPYFLRIVRNALSNAIRYTEQGDRVVVGCRRGGGLRLVIADSGRGMTEDQTRQAFDAFQRFDPAMSVPDGAGLGLFSTKSLANAMGLTVSLRSRPGHGTEFAIGIPPFAPTP